MQNSGIQNWLLDPVSKFLMWFMKFEKNVNTSSNFMNHTKKLFKNWDTFNELGKTIIKTYLR